MNGPRVCIDCTPLLLRSAGVKTYVYYWVQALRRARGRDAISLFPLLDEIGECRHERSVAGPLRTVAGLALLHAANGFPAPILNLLPPSDLFHASHQLSRPPKNRRVTSTLYDMTCWLVPEMHAASNVAMAKLFAERVIRKADGLVAISENTKRDAVRILGLRPEKIRVIYPGVAASFFDATPAKRQTPYALFVGTLEPRKNVGRLLDAWSLLPDEVQRHFDLVIAGSPGWGDSTVVNRLRSGINGVHYLGYVSEENLGPLTAGATVFIYPSLYEGFGLPVAQAMAARVPVVTSNTSCLPEVVGEGGLVVDPLSTTELRNGMLRILTSESLQKQLSLAGRKRAEAYSWGACAQNTWLFFDLVSGMA